MKMIGTNVSTEPTPPITPLTRNEDTNPSPNISNNHSLNMPHPSSISSWNGPPIVYVIKNNKYTMI